MIEKIRNATRRSSAGHAWHKHLPSADHPHRFSQQRRNHRLLHHEPRHPTPRPIVNVCHQKWKKLKSVVPR
jgi:hypothetical protein